MNTNSKIALAVVAGVAIGAAATDMTAEAQARTSTFDRHGIHRIPVQ